MHEPFANQSGHLGPVDHEGNKNNHIANGTQSQPIFCSTELDWRVGFYAHHRLLIYDLAFPR
jgi:hypothetical protein